MLTIRTSSSLSWSAHLLVDSARLITPVGMLSPILSSYPRTQPIFLYVYALLHLLERFHRSVQSMSVVSSKLGICALERRVSVGLWLLDAIVELKVSRSYSHLLQERSNPRQQECVSLPVLVSLLGLVVLGRVL